MVVVGVEAETDGGRLRADNGESFFRLIGWAFWLDDGDSPLSLLSSRDTSMVMLKQSNAKTSKKKNPRLSFDTTEFAFIIAT